jgi:hypothetical protein
VIAEMPSSSEPKSPAPEEKPKIMPVSNGPLYLIRRRPKLSKISKIQEKSQFLRSSVLRSADVVVQKINPSVMVLIDHWGFQAKIRMFHRLEKISGRTMLAKASQYMTLGEFVRIRRSV